jgi:hypothetical protein
MSFNLFHRFAIDRWLLVPFRRTFDINATVDGPLSSRSHHPEEVMKSLISLLTVSILGLTGWFSVTTTTAP